VLVMRLGRHLLGCWCAKCPWWGQSTPRVRRRPVWMQAQLEAHQDRYKAGGRRVRFGGVDDQSLVGILGARHRLDAEGQVAGVGMVDAFGHRRVVADGVVVL
jgi:hypothetical protein